MNLLALICFYSVHIAFHSTSGQHLVDSNALTHILTELNNLREAQDALVKSSELRELKSRVLSLEDTLKDLHGSATSLQSENKEFISVIHRLQHDKGHVHKIMDNGMNKQSKEIHESRTEIHEPSVEMHDQRSETHESGEDLNKSKAKLYETSAEFYLKEVDKKVEKENIDMTKKHNVRKSMVKRAFTLAPTPPPQQSHISGRHVAFTAGLSQSEVTLRQADTVIFDTVFTNIGDAYNANTGIIIAPTKGAYFLSIVMSIENNQVFYLQLMKDGTKINDIYADGSHSLDFTSTTKQWIIELNKGDTVWIRSGSGGELHGNLHTMITGFLLFETNA